MLQSIWEGAMAAPTLSPDGRGGFLEHATEQTLLQFGDDRGRDADGEIDPRLGLYQAALKPLPDRAFP